MPERIQVAFLLLPLTIAVVSCSGYRSTFVPRMSITQEYTDNLDLSFENPRQELITIASPGFTFATANPRRELAVSYDPSFTYYALTGTDMGSRHAANISAVERFSRYSTLEFTEGYVKTDDPVATQEITFSRTDEPGVRDDTLRRGTQPYANNTATMVFRHTLGPENVFSVRCVNGMLRNEDPTVEDSTRYESAFAMTYWFTQQYGLDTTLQYTRGDFSLDTSPFDEIFARARFMRRISRTLDLFAQYTHTYTDFTLSEPDYQVHDATMGVDYHLSQTTFLTMSGGYFIQRISGGGEESGYIVRGDMGKDFTRGNIRVAGGTGYRQTYFGAENLGFTQFYEGTLAGRYGFTRRLSGELTSTYSHNMYNDVAGRIDDILTFGATLIYQVRPWLNATLRYTYRDLDSTLETDSYQENRFFLGLTFVPQRPILLR